MKKTLCLLLCAITIFGTLGVPSFADNSISPYYNNTSSVNITYTITETGIATVSVALFGYNGTTTHADVSIKLQKRAFLLFWNDVDIGYPDNTYTDTIEGADGVSYFSFQLSSKGTYRAITTVTVYGSGGAADVIEDKAENKYD